MRQKCKWELGVLDISLVQLPENEAVFKITSDDPEFERNGENETAA